MPELPEVESSRRTLQRALKGKRLLEVIPDWEDAIVYDQASPEEFRRAIEGARVKGTGRKGKYLWLELDRRPWPVFHLGMTGNFELRSGDGEFVRAWGGAGLWSESKREGGRDARSRFLPFCRLRLRVEGDLEVAITDPRRFGRIRLAEDPLSEPPISRLGFDPLLDFPSARELALILGKRKAPIKAVLLDQGLFAGVGNWMADEILYQARLSPHRLTARLSAREVSLLRTKLLYVVKRAVAERADYDRYPKSWLFHYRWGREKDAQTASKLRIVHDTIGGRTTAWVPERQK